MIPGYPYKLATLGDRKGTISNDPSNRWYIRYYVWDVQKNTLVRKHCYRINQLKTTSERYNYAKARIKEINKVLKEGYHIDRKKIELEKLNAENEYLTLKAAIQKAFQIKENSSIAHGTRNAYRSAQNVFIEYLQEKKITDMLANDFVQFNCIAFLDWIRARDDVKTAKTVNKYRDYLNTFWSVLKSRGLIKENPWKGIQKEKERSSSQNIAFTDGEIYNLKEKISEQDSELWEFVQIMYYSLARPNEIRQLKVENVHFEEKKLFIPASLSKSAKDRWPVMHSELVNILQDLCKNKVSGEYLFPGAKYGTCISKNRMYDRHRSFLEKLRINKNCTLYSWKHTGVVKAYKAGVDIKAIQMQCGHYSIIETDTYLKSLHLYSNEEFILNMPKL